MPTEPGLRLMAVGDVMLGDSSHFLRRGVATAVRRHGPEHPWRPVAPLLEAADLFLGNLESPLAAEPGNGSWEQVYRAPAEAAAGLRRGGRTVVTLANNHILEHGSALLEETRSVLAAAGVGAAGYDAAGGTDRAELAWSQNGMSLHLFAETLVPDRVRRRVDAQALERRLVRGLEASAADVRIVSVHWGDEYVATPSPEQRRLARTLAAAGATIVIGHHPHVLQPVEEVDGALVAYSLGNFLFDHDWSERTRLAGILDVDVRAGGVASWRLVPTATGRWGQVRPATAGEAATVARWAGATAVLDEDGYAGVRAAAQRRHRLLMKLELLRHLPRVSPATWHFLATRRRRPAPEVRP